MLDHEWTAKDAIDALIEESEDLKRICAGRPPTLIFELWYMRGGGTVIAEFVSMQYVYPLFDQLDIDLTPGWKTPEWGTDASRKLLAGVPPMTETKAANWTEGRGRWSTHAATTLARIGTAARFVEVAANRGSEIVAWSPSWLEERRAYVETKNFEYEF